MNFLSKDIEDAYYASPLPLEGRLGDSAKYLSCLREANDGFDRIKEFLTDEQLAVMRDYLFAVAQFYDMEGMFYFQEGWQAAKNSMK